MSDDFNLAELDTEGLMKRRNMIIDKLLMLTRSGHNGSTMFNQLNNWFNEIEVEFQERGMLAEAEESGSVAIIGEDEINKNE